MKNIIIAAAMSLCVVSPATLSSAGQNRRAEDSRRNVRAGTELTVRTTEAIDSRSTRDDQVFSAVVERGVRDQHGRVIIPERSGARLVIRRISSGGAVGAAGGAGVQVVTRGRDVRVPAETVLTFRLDRPVVLQPEQ